MFAGIKKLVVAVVGLGLIVINNAFGIDLMGMEPAIVDGVLAVLTAVGVYQVSNEPAV